MVEGGRSGKTSEAMDSSLIVHTEDAVQALLDHLVEPLLPAKPSAHNVPSLSERETVAKQMHAVVLLYNYYHRKSYPHLEFLSFESFCKVAVNAKPSLLMHMRLMRGSNNCKLDNLDEQLSVAEKVIMDACNISLGLDASKDVPSMEGWPVSKVTVFLIDSMKNNCMLLFGLISLGVWSLIEKELDDPNSDLSGVLAKDVNKKKRINRRPLRGEKNSNEDGYLKVAFSAVKETTGIDEADIMVLESHTVYSLTKEKESARFYLIQSTKSTNEDAIQVPIKDTIDSLENKSIPSMLHHWVQLRKEFHPMSVSLKDFLSIKMLKGPLIKKNSGSWMVTSVVEHFLLLPYAVILSDWFSREMLSNGLELPLKEQGNPNLNRFPSTEKRSTKVATLQVAEILNSRTINSESEYQIQNQKGNGDYCAIGLSDAFHGLQKMDKDDSPVICSLSENESNVIGSSDAFHEPLKMDEDDSPVICSLSENESKKSLRTDQVNHHEKQTSIENGLNTSQAEMVDLVMKKCSPVRRSVKTASENDSCNNGFSGYDGTPTGDDLLCPSSSKNFDKIQVLMAPKGNELLQTAVRVLLKKRDKLSHQQRIIEDEIAQCDKNIQTILSGGNDDLVLKILMEGCNDVCSSGASQINKHAEIHSEQQCLPQNVKRKRLSEAILILSNPCKELDELCNVNNWILPRYSVFPSNGLFQASVTMRGVDFEYSVEGKSQADPREARESAATHMLVKIRGMANQVQ